MSRSTKLVKRLIYTYWMARGVPGGRRDEDPFRRWRKGRVDGTTSRR